jgi:hypothetical protein
MRTTINLDEETHELASLYANARGITLSAAVGELLRKAQSAPDPAASTIEIAANGLPILRSRDRVLTPEMVREAQEDEAE